MKIRHGDECPTCHTGTMERSAGSTEIQLDCSRCIFSTEEGAIFPVETRRQHPVSAHMAPFHTEAATLTQSVQNIIDGLKSEGKPQQAMQNGNSDNQRDFADMC